MKTLAKLLVAAALGLAGAAWLYDAAPVSKTAPMPAVDAPQPPELKTGAEQPNAGYGLASEGYRGIVAPNSGSVFNPFGEPPANPTH